MKKKSCLLFLLIGFSLCLKAQTKADGTPDMRYKANKEAFGNTYSSPTYSTPTYSKPSHYENGGQIKVQSGYMKSNGTYVEPHLKTSPDNNTWNNLNPK